MTVVTLPAGEGLEVGDLVAVDPATGKLVRAVASRGDQPAARAVEAIKRGEMMVLENDPVLGSILRKAPPAR